MPQADIGVAPSLTVSAGFIATSRSCSIERHKPLPAAAERSINSIMDEIPSEASFQVNGFGGAKLVRAEEMYQFGIIPVD